MIKAVVFDCFGVILTDALSVIVGQLEAREPDKVHDMRSIVYAANKGIIAPEDSTRQVADLLGISVDEYRRQIQEGEVRNQPLLEYIKTLRPRHKTAMLSNITEQGIARRFPNNELAYYFDEVIISSEIGYAKPEMEAYRITADRLGVELQECVFTDDRLDYVDAARAVGMQAFVYKDFAQFAAQLEPLLSQ